MVKRDSPLAARCYLTLLFKVRVTSLTTFQLVSHELGPCRIACPVLLF